MYYATNAEAKCDSLDRAAQQHLANVWLHLTYPRGRQRKRSHGGRWEEREPKEILVSKGVMGDTKCVPEPS